MKNDTKLRQIIWWRDKKLLAGFVIVILSMILGLYGKGLFLVKFYEPIYLITGLSLWVLSWILLFLGIFLVGWETVIMIKTRIKYHVKNTVKKTYHHAKQLPKKSFHYTRQLHRKSIKKISKKSREIINKMK